MYMVYVASYVTYGSKTTAVSRFDRALELVGEEIGKDKTIKYVYILDIGSRRYYDRDGAQIMDPSQDAALQCVLREFDCV